MRPVFKKQESPLDQGMVQRKTTINRRNPATDLRLSEPYNYKIIFLLDRSSFDELLKTVALKIAERNTDM